MNSLVVLTDAEAALVGGGAITQTISISILQQNGSTVSQTAIATNGGRVSATATGSSAIAIANGAECGNSAVVLQATMVEVLNSFRLGPL
jgi:hypothetical protein